MKKIKLFKTIAPITGVGLITSVVAPLCSCSVNTGTDKKDPDKPTAGLVKLNMNAEINAKTLLDEKTPLTISSSMSVTTKLCVSYDPEIANNHTLQYRTRIAGAIGQPWGKWTTLNSGATELFISPDTQIQLRCKVNSGNPCLSKFAAKSGEFEGLQLAFGIYETAHEEGGISIGGSLLSLLCTANSTFNDDGSGVCYSVDTLSGGTSAETQALESCFYGLFAPSKEPSKKSYNLIHVSNNLLPWKGLNKNCYQNMFKGCNKLKEAPCLPATTFTPICDSCYESMFEDCESLITAPFIPATSISQYCQACFRNMFAGCSSIASAGIGYVGNFDIGTNVFSNWLGGNLNNGALYYNGADTEIGENAIPQYFQVVKDRDLIENKTKTFQIVPGDTSCLTSAKDKLRCYNDLDAKTVSSLLHTMSSGKNSADTFAYDVDTSNPSTAINYNDGETAADVMKQTTDGKITPIYGFCPTIFADYTNVLTEEASIITVTIPAGAQVDYCIVDQAHRETENWQSFTSGTAVPFSAKTQIKLRAKKPTSPSLTNYINFNISGKVKLDGTVMSLLRSSIAGANPSDLYDFACYSMFKGSKGLISVSSTFLPCKTLTTMCYANMFANCIKMTAGPSISDDPATVFTGQGSCYRMFSNCSSMTSYGELPATKTIAGPYDNTYGTFEGMFQGCSQLKSVAPTKGIGNSTAQRMAFDHMFSGCSILAKAPKMSITGMKFESSGSKSPFAYMFENCKLMTSAKDVKITDPKFASEYSVGYSGFRGMFKGCESLTQANVPTFPTNISKVAAYGMYEMFKDCKNITAAPFDLTNLSDTDNHVNEHSFDSMFYGCSSLKRPMIISSTSKSPTSLFEGKDQPNYCYANMYYNCKSLRIKQGSHDWDENLPGSTSDSGKTHWFFKACNWTSGNEFVREMFTGCDSSGFTGTPSAGGGRLKNGRYSYGWVDY